MHYFCNNFINSVAGSGDEDYVSHWHILPNGDLVIESLLEDDAGAKVICRTRHKITLQEITSSTFTLFFSGMSNNIIINITTYDQNLLPNTGAFLLTKYMD